MSSRGLFTLDGVVDLHVHAGPSLTERPLDDVETAAAAAAAGMRAILIKDHFECTESRAYHARRAVAGLQAFGGIVLNTYVGGINPTAAEASLARGGKQVWMPTVDAQRHADVFGSTGTFGKTESGDRGSERLRRQQGITIAEDGVLKPEVKEVVGLVRDYDAILGTAHLYDAEAVLLVRYALDHGVRKVLITHVDWRVLCTLSLDQLEELVGLGAYVEFCASCTFPPACFTIEQAVAWMKAVGPHHCVVSSDVGAPTKPDQVGTLRAYGQLLLNAGMTPDELRTMMVDNPAMLLGL